MEDTYKSMGLLPDACGRSVSWDVFVDVCSVRSMLRFSESCPSPV